MNMPSAQHVSGRPALIVYLILCVLTLFTWGVAAAGLSGLGVTLLVLGVALLKGQMIGDWFMALRGIRGSWRWVVTVWLVLIGGLVTSAFVMAGGG